MTTIYTMVNNVSSLLSSIFSNRMNIFIFSSDRTYRTTSSSFYMLAVSICNDVYVVNILTTRLLSARYRIDFTLTSIIWCEMQQFLISTLSLISFHCSSLATMDQYLVILSSVSLLRLRGIQYVHRVFRTPAAVYQLLNDKLCLSI